MSTPHDPWWDGLAADPSRGPAAPPDRPATEAGADDQAAPVHTAPHEPVAEAEPGVAAPGRPEPTAAGVAAAAGPAVGDAPDLQSTPGETASPQVADEPAASAPTVADPAVADPAVGARAVDPEPLTTDATGTALAPVLADATATATADADPTAGDPDAADPAAADPAPVEPDSAGLVPPARSRRDLVVLVAALVIVGLLAAGVALLGLRVRDAQRTETAREQAVAASRDAARLLFSYDHSTLEADFARGLAVTTGEFREEYTKTTRDVVADVAKEYKAVVLADVVESAVVDADPDRVTTIVFLNQATTSTRVEGQQVDASRVLMTLVERDGRWLVSKVEAL